MRLISTLAGTTLFLFSAIVVQPVPKGESTVKGVVTDIADGRVTKAAVTFESNGQNLQTTTGADGTYSMRLEPGTYTMFIGHVGFCRARRAALWSENTPTFSLISSCGSAHLIRRRFSNIKSWIKSHTRN